MANRSLRALRGSAGFYSHWDDHEFVNDFSPAENSFDNGVNVNGRTLYRRGVQAFRDYSPVRYTKRDGLYRTLRWGKNLELFFLDQRSFRSANADEGGVCNNPQTGRAGRGADRAADHAQRCSRRSTPSLAQPVSQACLDAIRDPQRTYLGKRQLDALPKRRGDSTARFKVIMNELPIQQYYVLPYDRWEGYEAERQEVLRAAAQQRQERDLPDHRRARDARQRRPLQDARVRRPGEQRHLDVTVGPGGHGELRARDRRDVGPAGQRRARGQRLLRRRQPPNGVGMYCSSARPVQLRRGEGHERPAHGHAEGDRPGSR